MNCGRAISALVTLAMVVAFLTSISVFAQPACPYADIRLDSAQAVDVGAVCDAARPWADDGFRVFVLLTDYRPGSKDEWFDYLDQAEIEVGIRGADDYYDPNALAFEASTATDLMWAYSVTYGENLYETPLDEDDRALAQIETQMREAIAEGDPTGAFVQALNTAYEVNNSLEFETVVPTATPTATPTPSPWIKVAVYGLVGVVVAAVFIAGGVALVFLVILPAIQRSRQRKDLERHREALMSRTSNLLLACDQLLHGDTPEETVLYQLFSVYGGEHYKSVLRMVQEWLRGSQEALRDAFDVRLILNSHTAEEVPLEQQVRDWEMLYVTLTGNSERILELNDEELRTLLDPMLTLDREAPDVQLAEQLDGIRDRLVGMPLKVEFREIDPTEVDAEGILGYIDQVKEQISRLQEAQHDAPQRLTEAQERRREVGKNLSSPFALTEKQLLNKIDRRLKRARANLEKELFLRVVRQANDVLRDIETVGLFLATVAEHERRRSDVDAITGQGYRPGHLQGDLREVTSDVEVVVQQFAAGDYHEAVRGIEELDADSRRALAGAEAWQALQGENIDGMRRLREEVERLVAYRKKEVLPAWASLQDYPQGNWAEAGDEMAAAERTLASVRATGIAQIEDLNGLERQDFDGAERALIQTSASLVEAEGQFQAVLNCLSEVRAAEDHADATLRQAEADLERVEAFRDREDAKIDAEVDQQIIKARSQLSRAQAFIAAREFILVMEAQAETLRLASVAHDAASEQVQTIDALQAALLKMARSVAGKVGQCKSRVIALPAGAQKASTQKLVGQAANDLSKAKQERAACAGLEDRDLTEALRGAVDAYEQADNQADRALEQIGADESKYARSLESAKQAVRSARTAIRTAERCVRGVLGHGGRALRRAREALPDAPVGNESESRLARIREQAEGARTFARQAESQARAKTFVSRPRQTQTSRPEWSTSRPTASRPRPSSRRPSSSYKRPSSSRPTQRRPTASSRRSTSSSSRGSSTRSSSGGTSRRSSSRGSSARSSSRGSSSRSRSSGSSRRR